MKIVPEIATDNWRFTSRWWLLDRVTATNASAVDYTTLFEEVDVSDEAYFAPIFATQSYAVEGNVIDRSRGPLGKRALEAPRNGWNVRARK